MASHWPFDQWGRFLPEHTTAVSMLDRLLHHATVVVTEGEVLPDEGGPIERRSKEEGELRVETFSWPPVETFAWPLTAVLVAGVSYLLGHLIFLYGWGGIVAGAIIGAIAGAALGWRAAAKQQS